MFYQILLSPQVKKMRDYYLETWYIRVASRVAERNIGKCLNLIK